MGYSGDFNPTTGPGPIHFNKKVLISRLINSIYYFISTCFIFTEGDYYRLLAIREYDGKILIDKRFRTLKGARIAFTKQFQSLAWGDEVVAEWSHFYPPNREWIDEMLSIAENAQCN